MEEEIKKLREQINELKNELKKNQNIISQRIKEKTKELVQECKDIQNDEEIINLKLSYQIIERNVSNKLKQLNFQISEITEFENSKKEKIDILLKLINERTMQNYGEEYLDYKDYDDKEIQELKEKIDEIRRQKIITKVELENIKKEYQNLKKEKIKLEKEIDEIDKNNTSQHFFDEKKMIEEEIRELNLDNSNYKSIEIEEYKNKIEKINEEIEKNMRKTKEKKAKIIKIVKDITKLEEKYGKDKLEDIENKEKVKIIQQSQNQENDMNNKKEYKINFNKNGILCDGTLIDITKINNLQDFIKNIINNTRDKEIKLSFDLRGMKTAFTFANKNLLNSKQVKEIKELAYENRYKSEIIHGFLSKQEFLLKNLLSKIKQQHWFSKNQTLMLPMFKNTESKQSNVKDINR